LFAAPLTNTAFLLTYVKWKRKDLHPDQRITETKPPGSAG
jgi:hypothetical protein